MTVNDLINILAEGIRTRRISAMSPVVMVDEEPVFVVLDTRTNTVYVTDVSPEDTP